MVSEDDNQAFLDGINSYEKYRAGQKPLHEDWPHSGYHNPQYEIAYWNGWKEGEYRNKKSLKRDLSLHFE